MRILLFASLIAALGFVSGGASVAGDLEVRVSTPDYGVVIEDLSGQDNRITLAGPRVSIIVGEDMAVRVNDLDSPEVVARLDQEKGWTVWEGSYEVELIEDGEVKSRFRVQEATMILGRFESLDEGWTVAGD